MKPLTINVDYIYIDKNETSPDMSRVVNVIKRQNSYTNSSIDFIYENKDRLDINDIKKIIKKHINEYHEPSYKLYEILKLINYYYYYMYSHKNCSDIDYINSDLIRFYNDISKKELLKIIRCIFRKINYSTKINSSNFLLIINKYEMDKKLFIKNYKLVYLYDNVPTSYYDLPHIKNNELVEMIYNKDIYPTEKHFYNLLNGYLCDNKLVRKLVTINYTLLDWQIEYIFTRKLFFTLYTLYEEGMIVYDTYTAELFMEYMGLMYHKETGRFISILNCYYQQDLITEDDIVLCFKKNILDDYLFQDARCDFN